jgi:hypothetical protein
MSTVTKHIGPQLQFCLSKILSLINSFTFPNRKVYNRDVKKKQQELFDHVQKFISDNSITCPETIYQTDRIQLTLSEFCEKCCMIVGYSRLEEFKERSQNWMNATVHLSMSWQIEAHPEVEELVRLIREQPVGILRYIKTVFDEGTINWIILLTKALGAGPLIPEEDKGKVRKLAIHWQNWLEAGEHAILYHLEKEKANEHTSI